MITLVAPKIYCFDEAHFATHNGDQQLNHLFVCFVTIVTPQTTGTTTQTNTKGQISIHKTTEQNSCCCVCALNETGTVDTK